MILSVFIRKHDWLIAALASCIVVLFSLDVPVFWDMYGQIKTADAFISTGFSNLIPNNEHFTDNSHFPFYTLYLALWLKLLGFHLWAAHLLVLPFVAGLFFQIKKYALRFLSEETIPWLMLLLIAFPPLMAQGIFFSTEICIVFLSLWIINAVLDGSRFSMIFSSVLLCLVNLRGLALCGILILYLVLFKKDSKVIFASAGIIVAAVWLVIHYKISGWIFENPLNGEHRQSLTATGMLKNFFICCWKLLDGGMIMGWIILSLSFFKRKKISPNYILLLLTLLATIANCLVFSNPISNRYFLLVYVLLLVSFAEAVSHFETKKMPLMFVMLILFLQTADRLVYPNRLGNAWDCRLQSFPYFRLRDELDRYVKINQIEPTDVSAGFQLYFNDKFYRMNGTDFEYALLSDTEMPRTDYVAESNICNNYNPERELFLKASYSLSREFKAGKIYIKLYKKR